MEEKSLPISDSERISLCAVGNHSTLEEYLQLLIPISRTALRKYVAKKELSKSVGDRQLLHLPIDVINYGLINSEYRGPEISILFEDQYFLALSKPANIHIHPLRFHESDNLLSFVRSRGIAAILDVNRSQYDRGLLYRLDYETSGVVICTKSESIYQRIRDNFNSLSKRKIYRAIVHGKIDEEGEVSSYLAAASGGTKMKVLTTQKADDGHFAQLRFRRIDYNQERDLSYVQVELLTGLRHQIRVQLASLGHSILGDKLYGGEVAERLYLHAYEYYFRLDGSEILVRDSSLPNFTNYFNSTLIRS